jgi:3-hydroxy-3-methylglutaryl CoA synthase
MTIQRAIATPTVEINNEVMIVVANTLKYTEGFGETNVRSATAGGGSSTLVVSENAETRIRMLQFSVYPTKEQIDLIRQFKSNPGENGLAVLLSDNGFSKSINNAFITNDYEVNLGADTVIELELKGTPAK